MGTEEVTDVFSAGARSGFLWLALLFAIVVAAQFVLVRLKPKAPAAGAPPIKVKAWRSKAAIVIAGVSTTVLALIEMYASSRGLTPLVAPVTGAVMMFFLGKNDPARGELWKPPTTASGEVDSGPPGSPGPPP